MSKQKKATSRTHLLNMEWENRSDARAAGAEYPRRSLQVDRRSDGRNGGAQNGSRGFTGTCKLQEAACDPVGRGRPELGRALGRAAGQG